MLQGAFSGRWVRDLRHAVRFICNVCATGGGGAVAGSVAAGDVASLVKHARRNVNLGMVYVVVPQLCTGSPQFQGGL